MKRYLIIVVLLLFIALFFAVGTLGLFETNANMSVSANLANWSIKVNNLNAVTNVSTNFNVTSFIIKSANENTAANVFFPGSMAYFTIDFDVTDTQVSVMYEIEFDFSNISNKAIRINNIEETNGSDFSQIGFNKFAGIIPLSDMETDGARLWLVELIWDDLADNGTNDYNIGSASDRTLSIPVHIHAIQYIDGAESIWMNSKLEHIIDAALLYATDYYSDELNTNDATIKLNDLITPTNYLQTIEKDALDIISYYNADKTQDLSDLDILIDNVNDEVTACIVQNINNRTILNEDISFSTYMDLGYYCE